MPATPRATELGALIAAAGVDPATGLQVVAADRLAAIAFDPSLPLIVLRATDGDPPPVLPGRHARRGPASVLAALYPHGHPIRRLPDGGERSVETLEDDELMRGDWLVPPLDALDNLASPHGMAAISARLRAPDGCPWDRKQTHRSLRPYLLEEAYETIDAIEHGTPADLAEELGDLLLQVILHAQFAAEEGAFGGVARALPALPASREIQDRASSLGWDWDSIDGVWEKVAEEVDELHAAERTEDQLHEIGDVLFAIVNLARWMKVDPEEALREANHRWVARYRRVEALAAERGLDLDVMSLAEKDELWDEVKAG